MSPKIKCHQKSDVTKNQAHQLISNVTHQASSFPVASNTQNTQNTQNQHGIVSSRKVEKTIQKRDPLGNKLWKANGKPQLTTILVDEDVQGAQVSFTQSDQPNPPLVDQSAQSQGKNGGKGKGGSNKGNDKNKGGNNGKVNNNTNSKGTGSDYLDKFKCTLCGGSHKSLMLCPKLPQYLPYGNNQLQPPASLCL